MKKDRGKRFSESQLFAAIFFELAETVGDQIPSAELIQAAVSLVRLIENDFGVHKVPTVIFRSNYYSHETDTAIADRSWQILCRECGSEYSEHECFDPKYLHKRLFELGVIYD